MEEIRDAVFSTLLQTNGIPIRVKKFKIAGKYIIDFSCFPDELVKHFLKNFLIEIYCAKIGQFVEIIVSFLTYYSRFNRDLRDGTPTPIDNELMRAIGFDLLDLDYPEPDIAMDFHTAGYDLPSLLSMNDPKPAKNQNGTITISKKKSDASYLPNRKIFIVHGHDSTLKREVELYLRSLSLEPIILHQQVSRNKTIIEKVEFYSDVGFAVILLTADDIGAEAGISCDDEYSSYARSIDSDYLEEVSLQISEFLKKGEINAEKNTQTFVEIRDLYRVLKMRARQNVLFECGYFIGKLDRENVAILCDPTIEIPSDLNGLCYLKIDERGSWRKDLAMEIDAAGIKIDEKFLKYDIYERARAYLLEDGFKSLKITSRTDENQAIEIVYGNLHTLSPDFIVDMKSMGFIDSNDEITEIGNLYIQDVFWNYVIRNQ